MALRSLRDTLIEPTVYQHILLQWVCFWYSTAHCNIIQVLMIFYFYHWSTVLNPGIKLDKFTKQLEIRASDAKTLFLREVCGARCKHLCYLIRNLFIALSILCNIGPTAASGWQFNCAVLTAGTCGLRWQHFHVSRGHSTKGSPPMGNSSCSKLIPCWDTGPCRAGQHCIKHRWWHVAQEWGWNIHISWSL